MAAHVQSDLDRIEELWHARFTPDIDDTLYHYTSSDRFLDILDEESLRASNLWFMNDASELTHAEHLLEGLITHFGHHSGSDVVQAVFDKVTEQLNPLREELYDAYAFCLSEKDNDLSQWRAYGDGGRGVAIGFNPQALRDRASVNEPSDVELTKVTYEHKAKHDQVSALAKQYTEAIIQAVDEDQEDEIERVASRVRTSLRNVLPRFLIGHKPHFFKIEREWRLVHTSIYDPKQEIGVPEVRESHGRVVPYVEIEFEEGELPIEEVVQGPLQTGTQVYRRIGGLDSKLAGSNELPHDQHADVMG